jgi:hypothetical protein
MVRAGNKYEAFDLNDDGVVDDQEIKRSQDMLELELREEKAEAQKRMAWVALASVVLSFLHRMSQKAGLTR